MSDKPEIRNQVPQLQSFLKTSTGGGGDDYQHEWTPEQNLWGEVLKRAVFDYQRLHKDVSLTLKDREWKVLQTKKIIKRSNVTKWLKNYISDLHEFIFSDKDDVFNANTISQSLFDDDWESKLQLIRREIESMPNYSRSVEELIELARREETTWGMKKQEGQQS